MNQWKTTDLPQVMGKFYHKVFSFNERESNSRVKPIFIWLNYTDKI